MIVPDSGHLLYADNVDYICDKILDFEYESQEKDTACTEVLFYDSSDK